MSFGNILGQILQDGLGQRAPTRSRLETSTRNLGQGGASIEGILGSLQRSLGGAGGAGAASPGGALGGFADKARDFLQKEQVGGMSGGQITGIGAAAGALLGGGLGGAARGSALAVLGTLALAALRGAQSRAEPGAAAPVGPHEADVDPAEVEALTAPETEKLLVKAMVSAAKADGKVDEAEIQGILGKVGADSVTEEEKQFVLSELRAPLDLDALVAGVRTRAQAAEIYAASLLAISVDSPREQEYLRELARKLGLDAATVARLHEMTGAPA
jgi:uncharacterized membrane protein YebE (DUF533 family)